MANQISQENTKPILLNQISDSNHITIEIKPKANPTILKIANDHISLRSMLEILRQIIRKTIYITKPKIIKIKNKSMLLNFKMLIKIVKIFLSARLYIFHITKSTLAAFEAA